MKTLYKSDWVNVVDRNGIEVVERKPWAVVVAVKENKVLMVKQFRAGANKEIWNLPMGMVDPSDKDPLDTGRRELLEETGYFAREIQSLGQLNPAPPFIDTKGEVVLAQDLEEKTSKVDTKEGIKEMMFVDPVDAITLTDDAVSVGAIARWLAWSGDIQKNVHASSDTHLR